MKSIHVLIDDHDKIKVIIDGEEVRNLTGISLNCEVGHVPRVRLSTIVCGRPFISEKENTKN